MLARIVRYKVSNRRR